MTKKATVPAAEGMRLRLHISSKAMAGISSSSESNVFHMDKIQSVTPPFRKNNFFALGHILHFPPPTPLTPQADKQVQSS